MYNPLLIQTPTLESDIQQGSIGLILELCLREGYDVLDISSAAVKNIIIRNPAGVSSVKAASFLTDGTDGIMLYTTVGGDLDVAGTYYVQGYLELGSGFKGYTTITSFDAIANL